MQYKVIREYPLRQKMEKRGITIRELGRLSGLHYTYISRLLSGKAIATEKVKNKLEQALTPADKTDKYANCPNPNWDKMREQDPR